MTPPAPPSPHPGAPRPRAAIAAILGLVAAVALAGCNRAGPRITAVRTDPASPAVRGGDSGLEMWWWVVSDPWKVPVEPEPTPAPEPVSSPGKIKVRRPPTPPAPPRPQITRDGKIDLEVALAPYLDRPVPLPQGDRDRWQSCGLRIVAVPISDLEQLQNKLPLVGQVQRQWLGEIGSWTDIIDGPTYDRKQSLTIDDGVVTLDPGRLRLLARCWTVPIASESSAPTPALRLEVVPQHEPTRGEQDRLLAAAGISPGSDASGILFRRLAVGMTITGTDAYLIIPDRPAADWRAVPGAASDEPAGPAGPPASPPLTLGEAMLSTQETSSPRVRAVIVLLPRLPASYELLGR